MKACDILGSPLNLYHSGFTSFNTNLGGCFSIFFFVFSLAIFIVFGLDILDKSHPLACLTKQIESNPMINGNNLFFALAVTHPDNTEIVKFDSKFTFKAYYVVSSNMTTMQTEIDMIKCNTTSFFLQNRLNVLNKLSSANTSYYCLPENFSYFVQGDTQDSTIISYMSFVLR